MSPGKQTKHQTQKETLIWDTFDGHFMILGYKYNSQGIKIKIFHMMLNEPTFCTRTPPTKKKPQLTKPAK